MKKKIVAMSLSALFVCGLLLSSTVLAGKDGNGNGFPSGPHYNLNIIAVKNTNWEFNASEDGSNTIFVRWDNKSEIIMIPNKQEEFKVTDPDAVHGNKRAAFEIPWNRSLRYPAYDVYVRARGKPGGHVNISTEVINLSDNTTLFKLGTVSMLSHEQAGKGKPKPTAQCINNIFYVADANGTYWIFDYPLYNPDYDGVLWDYDNHGCKLLQVRFYENTSYTPPLVTT